ncbi:hypothetical protein L665_01128 [Ralstonia solanacearum SD54]|uniref:Uncharacterized protein n=2 Tax=Ralstonia solanacearum TaxID=305 RepID=A0A0S4VRG8_RALSL|nr:hypothetical protein F504_3051 [Ralstonia pseudosolanacearum FQY_4]ANH31613.1 hypothetical protein A3768_0433 [Ralstonia solanacearum]ESS50213.1 hypothetical protein L665_01128 [Ralstonia solanacearum SD54]ARU21202.1 DNA-binding protein [Ralstonia solanacearum]CUV19968.1 conserved protein of unknown function [Ralstonia solanacearum]
MPMTDSRAPSISNASRDTSRQVVPIARLPKLISEIEAYAAANGEAPSPSIRRKRSTAAGAAGS